MGTMIHICHILLSVVAILNSSVANPLKAAKDASVPQLDEQLYSRQIFVYGKSAQQSLSSSHVVITGSNKPLAVEIVKNLALAGVGRLTIDEDLSESVDSPSHRSSTLLNGNDSMAEYALSLNPLISVHNITNVFSSNQLTKLSIFSS